MTQRYLILAAAWLEIVTGVVLVAMLEVACPLLLAATPEGVGVPLGRLAGIGLLALGIACLPSEDGPRRNTVLGLLVYNGGVFILTLWLGLATPFHGLLLWPAVGLHAILTALLAQFLAKGSFVQKTLHKLSR